MTQHLVLLRSGEDKDQELINLFKQRFEKRDLVLIFVARKNTCDFVANMLNRIGIRASPMHSDRWILIPILQTLCNLTFFLSEPRNTERKHWLPLKQGLCLYWLLRMWLLGLLCAFRSFNIILLFVQRSGCEGCQCCYQL